MSQTSRFLIFAVLSTAPLACESESTETASTGSITTADATGVATVRVSDVHMLDLPEVELRLLHTTTTIPDLFFERVIAATFLPDSSLVVADHLPGTGRDGRLGSGEVLAALETRPTLPPGIQRGPVFLVLADDAGEIVDTLGQWAGKERHVGDDWNPVGFGLTAHFAGRGEHALVGTNDSLNLTLYRGTAPVTRIRGGYSPRMVTAAEKEEWTETFLGIFPEEVRANWRRRLEQSTIRDTYPAYGAISVDADGRIWIGDYPRLADEMRRWTILEADGTPVGTLRLPVLRPTWLEDTVAVTGQPNEVLDVAHGRIAVLRRDELGVEFVEVYDTRILSCAVRYCHISVYSIQILHWCPRRGEKVVDVVRF
ncbi:MAG: hypothetical protein J4G03_07700 [Gemmatimonadetes bacterium]|nr:hypothetical protein [Gemmatimonadota bacterium]